MTHSREHLERVVIGTLRSHADPETIMREVDRYAVQVVAEARLDEIKRAEESPQEFRDYAIGRIAVLQSWLDELERD